MATETARKKAKKTGRADVIWLAEKEKLKDLSGKLYIVTGANSGVGLETTRQLIAQGARVIMACRKTESAEEAARSFAGLKGSFEIMKLDLAELQSVRVFASEFLKKHDRLNGLVCNAGMVCMNNAYSEAKLATILYALELADRLKGTGVTTASVHPGWARSNFGQGGGLFMRAIMAIMRPLTLPLSNSNEESAQTTLHCLLSDDARNHSGAYFSQQSVLYSDAECKKGGWPMTSPNPNARDLEKAKKLVAISREIVGLA